MSYIGGKEKGYETGKLSIGIATLIKILQNRMNGKHWRPGFIHD